MEAKVRIMLSQTKNTWGYQELEEIKEGSSPKDSGESMVIQTP